MKIRQFRYGFDNFSYLIYDDSSALVIDPGAAENILTFIQDCNLELKYVANTHSHADHTSGNQAIINKSGAEYLANATLRSQKEIILGSEKIKIYHTPGHTTDSIVFHVNQTLITGDTLFNGTVGNCFSGDLTAFLKSIKMLLDLDEATLVYAGHDYVEESMQVARSFDPDNPHIDDFLKFYNPDHVYSTLKMEKKINPYLKFNHPDMINLLRQRGLTVESENERWQSLMSIG